MIKKIISILICLTTILFSQQEIKTAEEAVDKFSKSPFQTILVSGGAFYTGDEVEQMPMLFDYYSSSFGKNKNMKAVDGLFGSMLFEAGLNENILNLNIPQWQTNFKTQFSTFSLDTPIMKRPQIYSDILNYVFIDTSKTIISTNITLGENWNTLKIDYKDRVDTIVFSAKTSRIRTYKTQAENNTITIELGAYTTIENIPYPRQFTLTSKIDKRELRFNVTNVYTASAAQREASKLGFK